ncbi:MAG: helix-hairpin-helix domain-containing protein [Bacteroidaceae bacterium]|nr:helix-hairpin-helix domain-containing protein [Bacteroidaceae bacterium]
MTPQTPLLQARSMLRWMLALAMVPATGWAQDEPREEVTMQQSRMGYGWADDEEDWEEILYGTGGDEDYEATWEALMQELAERAAESAGEMPTEEQQEWLEELHQHPMDINAAERYELLELPFLSEEAVELILHYIEVNGPLRSMGELELIHGITQRERAWLRATARVVPMAKKDDGEEGGKDEEQGWWGSAEREATLRTDIPLYNRQGWPWNRGMAHRMKVNWRQGLHAEAGLRAENDAGERMFCRQTPLWDAQGGHLMMKKMGAVRRAIVGDYKAGFGEGLVMNNGLQLGKVTTGHWRTGNSIRPHSSSDEVNFLRGAAISLQTGPRWQLTALYSYRRLDATLDSNNCVSTISTSGYHRTQSELAKRGALGSHTAAVNAQWTTLTWRLGATATYQHYDHQFRQGTTAYRQIYPRGYSFGAAGVNYGYVSPRLQARGEVAFSSSIRGGEQATPMAMAALQKAAWRFSTNTQLTLIQRFYGKHYYAPYASAYGENSRVQNESGLSLQMDVGRVGPMGITAFVDAFYSPWPRYTMSRSSTGWEAMLQTTTHPAGRHSLLLVRYSVKSKEQSDRRHLSHRLRISYSKPMSARWKAQLAAFVHHYVLPEKRGGGEVESAEGMAAAEEAGAEGMAVKAGVPGMAAAEEADAAGMAVKAGAEGVEEEVDAAGMEVAPRETSTGIAVAPRLDYTSANARLRLSLMATLFLTADYNSRIYLYEPVVMQSFGMQMLYGRGQRMAATMRWRSANRKWNLQLKAGITHYSDRSAISSGITLIRSPWKADCQLLMNVRL